MFKFLSGATWGMSFFAIFLIVSALSEDSAPRAASKAAIALAIVFVPYALAKIVHMSRTSEQIEEIKLALKKQTHTDF